MKAEVFTLFCCLGEGSVPCPLPRPPPSASTMHFGGVTHAEQAESDDGKAGGVEQSGHRTRKETLMASPGTAG